MVEETSEISLNSLTSLVQIIIICSSLVGSWTSKDPNMLGKYKSPGYLPTKRYMEQETLKPNSSFVCKPNGVTTNFS